MPHLYYKEQGSGFPLVLIHGFCETLDIWKLITPTLANDFRIIAIDLPGFGKSSALQQPFTIDEVADAVIDFLQNELKLSACAIAGHSLGGYVTLSMVEKKPDLFKAFGLVHSTAYADSTERKASRNKVIEFVTQHGVEPFIESFIPPLFYDKSNANISWVVELGLQTPKATLIGFTEAMRNRPDRTHVIKSFTKPILFIAGNEDSVIPVNSLSDQAALTKMTTLCVLEGSAHMGMIENQDETCSVLREFLLKIV